MQQEAAEQVAASTKNTDALCPGIRDYIADHLLELKSDIIKKQVSNIIWSFINYIKNKYVIFKLD